MVKRGVFTKNFSSYFVSGNTSTFNDFEIVIVVAAAKRLCDAAGLLNGLAVVADAKFFPDGKRLITCGNDDVARIWDLASGRELQVLRGHQDTVNSVAIAATGDRVITASDDRTARIWDPVSGRELLSLRGHSGDVWAVDTDESGKRIVTASADHTAKIWEAATREESR